MWIRRTSRGRRVLPESFREVAGIWVGWGAEADVGAVVFWLALGVCDKVLLLLLFMLVVVLALLGVGSVVGGDRGCVGCDVWFGDAIFLE